MKLTDILKWRQYSRGLEWLAIALIGALFLDHNPTLLEGYTGRWLGACLKVATGAWGGYRISRDICRLDPSEADTSLSCSLQHLARALLIGLTILAVCVSI